MAGSASGVEREGALVHFGLGSNLGDRGRHLRQAIKQLRNFSTVEAISRVYETEPTGFLDQPDFWNLVVRARTPLAPVPLFQRVKQVETDLGRTPTFRNGPRVIDIDLLSYNDLLLHSPELELPHPRLDERTFVLHPLRDVTPDFRHPRDGRTLDQLLEALPHKSRAVPLDHDVLEEQE